MSSARSEWSLVAECASCAGPFTLTSTAVLVRETVLGHRGVVVDALGERWPEPRALLHPRCFYARYGRRALWTAFARGRFDRGVARAGGSPGSSPAWDLSVDCYICRTQVPAAGGAIARTRDRSSWEWLPALHEHRPGQTHVAHLRCFVEANGEHAAYLALGRDIWRHVGPLVKKLGGAVGP